MIGALAALGCALLWALSSVLVKTQTERLSALFINAFRCAVGTAAFGLAAIAAHRGLLARAPASAVLALVAGAILGFAAGDTLYYRSMRLIGVSRTLPISAAYPAFTMLVSVALFGASVGWTQLLGCVLVAAGVYLVGSSGGPAARAQAPAPEPARDSPAASGGTKPPRGSGEVAGIVLALAAALCWSFGVNLLDIGLRHVDILSANAVRMSAATVALLGLTLLRHRGIPELRRGERSWAGGRSLGVLALSALVGSVAGSWLFVSAVKLAGPSTSAILSSTAPLFGLPMALIGLKERVTLRLCVGAAVTVGGIAAVML